jgi:hypothetical protein
VKFNTAESTYVMRSQSLRVSFKMRTQQFETPRI